MTSAGTRWRGSGRGVRIHSVPQNGHHTHTLVPTAAELGGVSFALWKSLIARATDQEAINLQQIIDRNMCLASTVKPPIRTSAPTRWKCPSIPVCPRLAEG